MLMLDLDKKLLMSNSKPLIKYDHCSLACTIEVFS